MATRPLPEPVGLHYAPYIQELREFFAASGLRFGAPEDVFSIAERLEASPDFSGDLSSMVRAILLREGGSMPHAELLEILAFAIGGPEMERAPQHYRQPLRHLLAFLTGVLRRPWNIPPGERPTSDRGELLEFPSEAPAFEPAEPTRFSSIATHVPAEPATPPGFVPPADSYTADSAPPTSIPLPSAALSEPEPAPPEPAVDEPAAAVVPEEIEAELPPAFVPEVAAPEPVAHTTLSAYRLTLEAQPSLEFADEPFFPADLDTNHWPNKSHWPDEHYAPAFADFDPAPDTSFEPGILSPSLAEPAIRRLSHTARGLFPTKFSPSFRSALLAVCAATVAAILLVLFLRPHAAPPAALPPIPSVTIPTAAASQPPAPAHAKVATENAQPAARKPSPYVETSPVRHTRGTDADSFVAAPYTTPVPPQQPVSRPQAASLPAASAKPAAGTASAALLPATPAPKPNAVAAPQAYAAAPGPYLRVAPGVMASNLLSAPDPGYPMLARLAHVQGRVVLRALIAPDGRVASARVLKGHHLLRHAAVDAVRHWRYRPYFSGGHPVGVSTTVAVVFQFSAQPVRQ